MVRKYQKFDPTKIEFIAMQPGTAKVGQKVLTVDLERGTIKEVNGDDISVRLRGDQEMTYYIIKELHLMEDVFEVDNEEDSD